MGGNGFNFAGDYRTKGCYAYKEGSGTYGGISFYGNGGKIEQMKEPPSDHLYRPDNYDCPKQKGNFQIIHSLYLKIT